MINEIKFYFLFLPQSNHKWMNVKVTIWTHFISSAKAMIPDAIAVAAEVDANVDVQVPLRAEVI